MTIGSVAFHRVAEMLMGKMQEAASAGDFRMAAAYAQMAADADGRALTSIPVDRQRTRHMIWQSQVSLVDKCLEYEAKADRTRSERTAAGRQPVPAGDAGLDRQPEGEQA